MQNGPCPLEEQERARIQLLDFLGGSVLAGDLAEQALGGAGELHSRAKGGPQGVPVGGGGVLGGCHDFSIDLYQA